MKIAAFPLTALAILSALAGCSSSSKTVSDSSPVTQLSFDSPADAVTALTNAAATGDLQYAKAIFGPEADQLSSGDPEVDAYERRLFSQSIQRRNELRTTDSGSVEVLVGERAVPFPVPLVNIDGRWIFDTLTGIDRLTDLRIGTHELRTLDSLRGVVVAQREYQSVDRDGDGVLEFATKFLSSPGKQDGLYWPTTSNEPNSPLGAFYIEGEVPNSASLGYQGYFFKILTEQGSGASGGARSYFDSSGNFVSGFAVLAYPAQYGVTAIMTFQMSADGVIYQKDLGSDGTPTAGMQIKVFDTREGWLATNER